MSYLQFIIKHNYQKLPYIKGAPKQAILRFSANFVNGSSTFKVCGFNFKIFHKRSKGKYLIVKRKIS